MPHPRTRAYLAGELIAEDFPVAAISDHLAQPDVIVWADFLQPSIDDLHELAGELGLHELAVEDAVSEHQRPKVDYYDTHLFLSCHAIAVDPGSGVLEDSEIDAFVSPRWLITIRKTDEFDVEQLPRRWDRSRELVAHGVSALLYGLLDVVIDDYFTATSVFDDYYENVTDTIFGETPLDPSQQRDWFERRRALSRFHRLVVPMREAVSGLMRHDHDVIAPELMPYFQDVYDHILRVSESTDVLRDLATTIVETNLALRDYRQNQVMKRVTSWAAIIAVPTLITGYYGMNVPYPGVGHHWGFVVSTVLSILAPIVLYVQFRARDWL